ncbi:hypothetical protein CLD22_14045 [Rubrivivax gelatinosus]|nr:hypothetical protein [Rubrivivax gelatinosus]
MAWRERVQRSQALRAKPWVLYAKTALAGAAAVLDYVSRDTQRTAIGHERLRVVTAHAVRFVTRVNRKQHSRDEPGSTAQPRLTSLPGEEFVERLLQPVLPSGFKRIRYYGLLAPAAKAQRQACARTAGHAGGAAGHPGGRGRVHAPRGRPGHRHLPALPRRAVAGAGAARAAPCPGLRATDERRGRACGGPPERTL